jgi:malate synthase
MEDAATAEICRAQLWQWQTHGARMCDGRTVTTHTIRETILRKSRELSGTVDDACLAAAARLFEDLTVRSEFDEFLTLRAYEHLD